MRAHRGINAFIRFIRAQVNEASPGWKGTVGFILRISEDCAFIRLQDIWHPVRFFKQMSGKPPIRFGTQGFKKELLDDQNPARHYIAFVFVGFWLPYPLAALVLWLWEALGFLRYGFFSQPDMELGWIGIAHGAQVRRHGATVLPHLIEQGLGEKEG